MMGGAMSAAQTMPMLAGGVYQMGLNRGGIPMVSVNDQTFAQMGPRGGGVMSWADVAKVASEHQASVSGTVGILCRPPGELPHVALIFWEEVRSILTVFPVFEL